MNKRIKNTLPLAVDEQAKEFIKAAAMKQLSVSKKGSFVSRIFSGHKQLAFSTLSGLVVFAMIGGFLMGRNPLTMQRVLAGAIENLDQKTASGKWTYRKTRDTMEFRDGRSYTAITEMWNVTQSSSVLFGAVSSEGNTAPNSSYKTVLEDGRVVAEDVTVDGVYYTRDTREVQKEVFGYDPYASFSETSVSSEDFLPPGFAEAGLTTESFNTMSMKQVDDALIAAGQEPFNAPQYKTTDFPAYTMTPGEIEAFMKERGADEQYSEEAYNELYGGADSPVYSSSVITSDGRKLTGEEADTYMEQEQARYEDFNKLRMGSIEEKKQALKTLQEKGSATLKENVEFEGRKVIAIESENSQSMGNTEIVYLDPKTFDLIGEEYSFEMSEEMLAAIPEALHNSMTVRMKMVYLELRFTNEEPVFSTEGLIKSDDFFSSLEQKTE